MAARSTSFVHVGPPLDELKSPHTVATVTAARARVGPTVLQTAPQSRAQARDVIALLQRNYADNASLLSFVTTSVGAAFRNKDNKSHWNSGECQVWLLTTATGLTVATLLWRWLPTWSGVECLFSTTDERFRRLGYGKELAEALKMHASSIGATGMAVSCVGYGDCEYEPSSYGKAYWTSLRLTIYSRRGVHYEVLSRCMMTFPDTRIHVLLL